jgi:hypothetical protein
MGRPGQPARTGGRIVTGRDPGRGTESARLATLSAYGPVQLAGLLGLGRWQLDRALAGNLIPGPDAPRGKWSRAVAQDAAARVKDIRAAAGTIPDLGAVRAAEVLTGRLGTPVSSDGVAELGRRGLIPVTGYYNGFALYDGRTLETFTDAGAAAEATRAGQLCTADQAAAYLRIRRTDLGHLTRAGLLVPAGWGHGPFDRRTTCSVPLYRTADLDGLTAASGIGWDAVRATPKGHRSPLARLPDAPRGRARRRRARKTWRDGPDAYRGCQPPEDDPGTASAEGGDRDMTAPRDTWT